MAFKAAAGSGCTYIGMGNGEWDGGAVKRQHGLLLLVQLETIL
jgi:hypothetical protein